MIDRKLYVLAILGIMGVVAVSGCTSQQNTNANTVTIQNFAFNPAALNVQVGTTVTWINKDSATHHVVSDTGLFDSGNLGNGQSYSYTFKQTGSYPYHCSIHPSMKGTIVVSTNAPSAQSNNNPSTTNTAGSGGIKY